MLFLIHLLLVPTSPPLNVKGFLNVSGKLIVTWEPVPVEHRLGIILGYHVMYAAQNGGTQQEMRVNAFNLSTELQNLQKFKLYDIKVAAFNIAGEGPPSPVIVVRSQDGGKSNCIL